MFFSRNLVLAIFGPLEVAFDNYPAKKLRNNYVIVCHFLVTNKHN